MSLLLLFGGSDDEQPPPPSGPPPLRMLVGAGTALGLVLALPLFL